MLTYLLDIGNQMPGSVLFQTRMRSAFARTALLEKHHPILAGIEVAAVFPNQTTSRSAVKKNGGLTSGVANLLIVEIVNGGNLQPAGVERFDVGVESFHARILRTVD